MRSAATVLDVIRERGRQGLPLERLYRQLFNPQLFLLAYGRIYANKGSMTPGVTPETVDGMSQAKIAAIIDVLRGERYRWRPVKRVFIPKKNGKLRPLGLPTWSDKLVAEVVRLLLEAYYDVQFSDRSHGTGECSPLTLGSDWDPRGARFPVAEGVSGRRGERWAATGRQHHGPSLPDLAIGRRNRAPGGEATSRAWSARADADGGAARVR